MNVPRIISRTPMLTFSVALLIVALSVEVAQACPSCKQALADSKGGDMIAGYFWSILFMMSMPFTLLGGFSGYMYLLVRRARATSPSVSVGQAASAEASPPDRELVDA